MTRAVAEHEIQRILALVPWLVAHPGSSKVDIARRFGISAEQLGADLDLVLMIGVPPYSPGDYIDVEFEGEDDEFVTVRMADSFRRPIRLSPTEGLAVLTAGRALLAVAGSEPDGPLARALDKLAAALDYPDLVIEFAAPTHLETVRAAAAASQRLEIDYWSAGRDELTTRTVDPYMAFFAQGEWYLSGYCHRARDDRLFRVDRIRAARPTGDHFEGPCETDLPDRIYAARPDDPRVTLRLAENARWVTEQYPFEALTVNADGSVDVTLAVSEPAFLERLLLRLGTAAKVVSATHSETSAAVAATRVLSNYRGAHSK